MDIHKKIYRLRAVLIYCDMRGYPESSQETSRHDPSFLSHEYPMAVRGEGVYLYDANGKQYLDVSGGAAISCLGHGNPVVIDAIKRQAEELAFAHTMFFTNLPQEKLAAELVERFSCDDARVYFLSGGSEANETAIKLARQYWLSQDCQPPAELSRQYHRCIVGIW